jgi:putative peptide zinc metalloprotease protein
VAGTNFLRNLRLRADLVFEPQDRLAGTWVVKDPVALRFFQFGADEHFVLRQLDGKRTADEILEDFARQRAPRRMTADRLQSFLAGLCRNGLTCWDGPGQGPLLLEQAGTNHRREALMGWTNVLAIRFAGFNPDALLDRIYPLFRWCFSWWFAACSVIFWLAAAGVVVARQNAFAQAWPRAVEFVSGSNLIWLAIALALTKVLHELAHALTCKHFGGRCHELGLMLLVFTPCLYCNVTDAWMLRHRWQRIAISAAGILMEFQLASLAVVVWAYTLPGPLHSICLNVIVVCSVGTLMFNGNPLLKYDGYFILSDLVRVPNLWQHSRSCLHDLWRQWILGDGEPTVLESPARRALLVGYALASIAYRLCLTAVILLLLYRVLHPSGLDLLLLAVGASLVVQTIVARAAGFSRWWSNPLRMKRLRKVPVVLLVVVAVGAIVASFRVPLPCRVSAPVVLEMGAADRVYVDTPGVLIEAVAPGAVVAPGQSLVLLVNQELESETLRIKGDLRRAEARVRTLQAREGDEVTAAAQLLVAREIRDDLAQQLQLRVAQQQSLKLPAPTAGKVVPPPAVPARTAPDRELPGWTGTPLDPENRGAYLERGTLVCLVGDGRSYDGVVFVDETDVPYLRVGQQARIRLQQSLGLALTARVVDVAQTKLETTPIQLASQHDVAVRADSAGERTPVRTIYQVRLAIDATNAPLLVGARGVAEISVLPQTIAQRIVRWLRRTLTIDATAGV